MMLDRTKITQKIKDTAKTPLRDLILINPAGPGRAICSRAKQARKQEPMK